MEAVSVSASASAGAGSSVGVSGRIVVRRSARFLLDVDIDIGPGEIAAIMGPSGAGKSTLLGAIAGSVALTGGQVSIAGRELSAQRPLDRRNAGVALLGQRPLLFPHLSVRENVAFGLRARRIPHRAALLQADGWLDRVGLEGMGAHRPGDISGGQQQRVALARALATEPRLLLLDEPLTSLDAVTASDVRALLREQLAATGTTTIIVTHDAFDAAALAERLLVIEEGVITQRGTVREVLENPATRFVAAAAGLNRLHGVAVEGAWTTADPGSPVRITSTSPASAVPDGSGLIAVFRPADAVLTVGGGAQSGGAQSGGAESGRWNARVERLEPSPGGAHVHVTEPDLIVEITSAQVAALALVRGDVVEIVVAPEHVRLIPAPVPDVPAPVPDVPAPVPDVPAPVPDAPAPPIPDPPARRLT